MMVGRIVAGLGTGMNTGMDSTFPVDMELRSPDAKLRSYRGCLAGRNEQNAKPWKTGYHTDG
jgi:hypothetical protein